MSWREIQPISMKTTSLVGIQMIFHISSILPLVHHNTTFLYLCWAHCNDIIPSDSYKNMIAYSLGEFEDSTCLRFRKLETDDRPNWPQDYIVFNDSDHGCSSYIGRQGGPQLIGLQAGACTFSGPIMHEIFHALGTKQYIFHYFFGSSFLMY